MLTSLVFYAFLRVDNFFVEKYCSAVELSNYVQCGKVGQYFLYFASIVSSTLLPFFAEQKMENNFEDWKMMIRPYVLLMLIGMVLIAVFGKFAFPFLFGISFNQMHGLMLVLLPGYFCLGMLTLVNVIYLGNKNIKRIVIGDSIGLIMVVVFDAIFLPQYGVYAAAIISSIVYCIVFLIVWLGAKKTISFINMSIQQTYCYRLFKHSKLAFIFVGCFVLVYIVLFYKKMDMMPFPYNNMFSQQNQETTHTTYFVKLNGKIIPYTSFMYWKKDFLEQSGYKYQEYIGLQQKNYLSNYIAAKSWSPSIKERLEARLCPSKMDFSTWVKWYSTYANATIPKHAQFELVAFTAKFNTNQTYEFQSETISNCIIP